ncbi:copper chaperone PCu(A)C [Flavisphingomonas formosensis]|uniref:copper chaperone PCu(A)C n=1 Tax=Flavisphingomonas formosensis TaxID=861534 RepID=UPI0012F9EA78|nr:copper chaperone PCu(A)C [Sphingomonas formosensis]
MRRAAIALVLPFALAACHKEAKVRQISVEKAWVRLSAVPGRPAAAYFTIKGGSIPDTLVQVSANPVATIELHEGGKMDGMMTMKPIASVPIPADTTVRFEPGGNHAMLFGVDPKVQPGVKLALSFKFATLRTFVVAAPVVGAADPAPEGSGAN